MSRVLSESRIVEAKYPDHRLRLYDGRDIISLLKTALRLSYRQQETAEEILFCFDPT